LWRGWATTALVASTGAGACVGVRHGSGLARLRVVPSRRRHPKKDLEYALAVAEAAGWAVEEIHRGHRWGVVRCPSGEHQVAIWSTPRDPATVGKRLREAVARCPHRRGEEVGS
jgi:hypothetical protein